MLLSISPAAEAYRHSSCARYEDSAKQAVCEPLLDQLLQGTSGTLHLSSDGAGGVKVRQAGGTAPQAWRQGTPTSTSRVQSTSLGSKRRRQKSLCTTTRVLVMGMVVVTSQSVSTTARETHAKATGLAPGTTHTALLLP